MAAYRAALYQFGTDLLWLCTDSVHSGSVRSHCLWGHNQSSRIRISVSIGLTRQSELLRTIHTERVYVRLHPSTHVSRVNRRRRASTPIWNKACTFTPSASTSVDGCRRAWCECAGLFHGFHIGVDTRLRPSTSVEGHRRAQNRTMLDFEHVYMRQQA